MFDIVKTMCYLGKRDAECIASIHFKHVKDKGSAKNIKTKQPDITESPNNKYRRWYRA